MNEKKGFSKTEPFRLGPHKISLEVLIGAAEIDRLEKKFQQINSTELWICLREVVRFIYLCGHSPSSLFFPGDQLVDDVWHALIIETESYKTLCAKLNAGTFIHHSGVKFEDYVQEKGDKRVHEEQVSWLASYLHNFGPIEPEAFKHLTLGSSIATQLETDLAGVNQWAESLIQLSQFQNQSALPSSIDKYVEEQVKPHSALIAENPRVLIQKLKDLLKITSSREVNLLSSQELEKVFEGSVSLGFTLWQHLAAVERLSGLKGWQEENQSIWKKLAAGQTLCGLATTHLANPKGSPIKGTPVENGYKIQGSASWVCGCDLFEKLLIGFSTSDTVVFALIDFPHFLDPSKKGVEISMNEMDILAGTSTVRLSFSDFFVSQAEVVSSRGLTPQNLPRPTQYLIPELGIGRGALALLEENLTLKTHPKSLALDQALQKLKTRLKNIERLRDENPDSPQLVVDRDNFNRDSVRLLALGLGSQSLKKSSTVLRLQSELLLLDCVVHAPEVLNLKILDVGQA